MPHPDLDSVYAVHTSSTVCSAHSRLGCEVAVWTYVLERPVNTPSLRLASPLLFVVTSKRQQRNWMILGTT